MDVKGFAKESGHYFVVQLKFWSFREEEDGAPRDLSPVRNYRGDVQPSSHGMLRELGMLEGSNLTRDSVFQGRTSW